MAFVQTDSIGWHEGERRMHSLMQVVNEFENPTDLSLTPGGAYLLGTAPLLAIGTLGQDGRPWTSIWGGEPGFSRPLGSSNIGIKTLVDRRHDPVLNALLGDLPDGEVAKENNQGQSISGLAIDLAARTRVKLAGRMCVGAFSQSRVERPDAATVGEVQLLIKVDSSLLNCPKYLNKKKVIAKLPAPKMISSTLPLPKQALELLAKADLFFMTSSVGRSHMSTNHRGGSPGFVRVMSNNADGVHLVYPEYSGNRLYQTLGNLQIAPEAGFVFPNFDNGDVLYITANTEIIFREEAAKILPRSNLIVKIIVQEARFVEGGLSFQGEEDGRSPYNPAVRHLTIEGGVAVSQASDVSRVNAKLLERALLTPTIARFRFSISDPTVSGRWKHGQYVALSFEDECSAGYSHMRNDDPKSLNDDYVRTFTVSSPPGGGKLPDDEFEITVRNVGVVTKFMFRQNVRAGLEVPLLGFGGDFVIEQKAEGVIPIVAGGVGITPLLGQTPKLDLSRLRLFWSINAQDIGLVWDTLESTPALAGSTILYISGLKVGTSATVQASLAKIVALGSKVMQRRIIEEDLQEVMGQVDKWYVCAGSTLKSKLLQWLTGKKVVYEDFNY
ncbi:hypothetical protein MMC13_007086 [Lambiella insularis]|nr:hypothetical protein [Lambiella insularis]